MRPARTLTKIQFVTPTTPTELQGSTVLLCAAVKTDIAYKVKFGRLSCPC